MTFDQLTQHCNTVINEIRAKEKPLKQMAQGLNRRLPNYPASHKLGMVVPRGGSDCAKCEYVDGQNCKEEHFIQWNGGKVIPANVNEWCCDFYSPSKKYVR